MKSGLTILISSTIGGSGVYNLVWNQVSISEEDEEQESLGSVLPYESSNSRQDLTILPLSLNPGDSYTFRLI